MTVTIPLATVADGWLRDLAAATGGARLAATDGATLLGERAMLGGFRIPAEVSAGGGCRLYAARDGSAVALNLARPADRELLPALFGTGVVEDVAALIGACDPHDLVACGRVLGLAIAAESEAEPAEPACTPPPPVAAVVARRAPRILDLSALWAGPLASHLLWLAGAEVIRVESRSRPDAMRDGDGAFFALLNQGKASVALDLHTDDGRRALCALIARSDIVIEAARPRALAQLGIDVDAMVRTTPGLTWIGITGHGTRGAAADWVGFGDDCGVAGGLAAALRAASGRAGFVGDAIADPLTGLYAAKVAWGGWAAGRGGRFAVSMRGVVAAAIAAARARDADGFERSLADWAVAAGAPFSAVQRRATGSVPALGADTQAVLAAC